MYSDNIQKIALAQQNNKEIMEELVLNNSGLVWNIVKRFNGRGYEKEDLYQIGCIGLIKAVQRFDISFNVRISTYAVPYIIRRNKKIYKR